MSNSIKQTNCPICGEELIPGSDLKEHKCSICGKSYISEYSCKNGHEICSRCALKEFYDNAKEICLNTDSRNPVEIADKIMNIKSNVSIGKFYIIAPIALYTAYKNSGGKVIDFENSLDKMKDSAMKAQTSLCRVGGFCGIPTAVGRGMYVAYIGSENKEDPKIISNKIAGFCMRAITNPDFTGSNDCCERNTYVSIIAGVIFIRNHLWVDLELPSTLKCQFSEGNPNCNKERCLLYKGRKMMKYS